MRGYENSGEDPGLSREDGIAALESAASMVCGSCDRCGMKQECLEDQDGENYFLYYLLRSFEKKGALEYPDHAQGVPGPVPEENGLSAGIK